MNCPKIYAIYLPQFHETEDNNKWWGKGFTDWTTVKKAESLFPGHLQPNVPIDRDYYNPTEVNTLKRQAKLAEEYDVDGFVFYHYWFGEGKMELEKPAEILLEHTDINMPFCFSWANQSWVRTWSKFTGNVWGERIDKSIKSIDDGMLVEQKYGNETEWKRHFEYLLPFFLDDRYIRIDDKPVFIFYSPSNIGCLGQMVECWRHLATENGLKGMYLIGYNSYSNNCGLDAVMMSEPTFSIRKLAKENKVKMNNGVRCVEYEDFVENSVATLPSSDEKTYFTGACGYDTTPRRGNTGECIINRRPDIFERYIYEMFIKAASYNNEFMLINAWNEWGEGMYIEPDERDKYAYLKAIKRAKEKIRKETKSAKEMFDDVMGQYEKKEDEQSFLLGKFQSYYKVCSLWIDLLVEKKFFLSDYLKKQGINKIVIYGFADIGRKLYRQLQEERVPVEYAIDQYVGDGIEGVKVYRPEEELPESEMIIITAYEPNEIRANLITKVRETKIVSLLELLEYIKEENERDV